MKRFLTLIVSLAFVLSANVTVARAETVIGAQVAQTDLTLTKAQSPYIVTGLLQIPAGKTLSIEPGVEVTFAPGSGVKAIGAVRIGSLESADRVKINLNTSLQFIGNGIIPSTVSILRTDIYGKNSQLVYGCKKLEIVESYMEKISQIVAEQECPSLSIRDSYLNEVKNVYEGFFDGAPEYFELKNNIIVSMAGICCRISDRTMGSSDAKAVYRITNNNFKDLESLNIPWGYLNYTFSNNNFFGVKNVRVVRYFGNIPNSKTENLAQNYWAGAASDSGIRKVVNVVDGKSDIGIGKTIVFEPLLPNPAVITGFPATKQAALDKAVSDQAAAAKVEKKYKNCSELNKVFKGGVARNSNWANKGGKIKQVPAVNSKVYDLNKSLDRDKDGLACER